MAKNKRHSIFSDMNAMNLDNTSAMSDQEREQLRMNMSDTDKKMNKRKKAM